MKKVVFVIFFWTTIATKLGAEPLTYQGILLRDFVNSTSVFMSEESAENGQGSSVTNGSNNGADKKFWSLVAAQHIAMVWDGYSAYEAIARCHAAGWTSCRNANPVVGMFMERGATAAYIAGTTEQIGIDMLALVMKRSENKWARQTWFLLPLALTVMHTKDIIVNERSFRPGIISSIRIEDLKK